MSTVARNGTEVEVAVIPDCDICKLVEQSLVVKPAVADVRTKTGQWGYVCEDHLPEWRMHDDFGTGKGQRLILKSV